MMPAAVRPPRSRRSLRNLYSWDNQGSRRRVRCGPAGPHGRPLDRGVTRHWIEAVRRERDSNPRRLASQRFSRPTWPLRGDDTLSRFCPLTSAFATGRGCSATPRSGSEHGRV